MITFKQKGDFRKTTNFLNRIKALVGRGILDKYGERGVRALKEATPVDSGNTRDSWYYEIETTRSGSRIMFCNSNIQNGVPIAIILQYGHGTRNGGYVQGVDYINPAVAPVFDDIINDFWEEVTKS